MSSAHDHNHESHFLGILRWRGYLNWKDISERMLANIPSGIAAGVTVWVLIKLLGGA